MSNNYESCPFIALFLTFPTQCGGFRFRWRITDRGFTKSMRPSACTCRGVFCKPADMRCGA